MKKIICCIMVLCMLVPLMAFADDNAPIIYYKNGKNDYIECEHNLDYYVQNIDSSTYSKGLAYMLMGLSWSAYNNVDENNAQNTPIYKSFQSFGMQDIKMNNYYEDPLDENYGEDNCAYTIGYREMDNGKNLVAVVIRGSFGEITESSDWNSNFNCILTGLGNHKGFEDAASKVTSGIFEYLESNNLTDCVYVVTGHSRGAAVANLASTLLLEKGINKKSVYNYNFACPDTTTNRKTYSNIFNICNYADLVTQVPRDIKQFVDILEEVSFYTEIPDDESMPTDVLEAAVSNKWYKNGQTLWFNQGIIKETYNDNVLLKFKQIEELIYNDSHSQSKYLDYLKQLPEIGTYSVEGDIVVEVNGKRILSDQPPVIVDDRTLVPLRAIFEAMNAEVDWNNLTKTVTSTKDDVVISLTIGSKELIKNGTIIELDVSPQIINSRTMVPVRAIAESFGAVVDWDEVNQAVIVTE